MQILAGVLGGLLIGSVLWEAFETIVLPRRVTRRFRLTRVFYRTTWVPWSAVAKFLPRKRRESYLSIYGPLSLIFLIALWAVGLVIGFALLQWAAGSGVHVSGASATFATDLYMSGTTFFTLGLGDVTPMTRASRLLTVLEAGMGFGFLAIVIGYLPVLYQSFSRREVNISLLDARAGSPPSAAELLRRHAHEHGMEALQQLLHEWERWSAELMESHLSYPVLSYFRSQHDNQSWLGALTTILDASALVMAGLEGACERQAELTFAIARHAVVDLAQIFSEPPRELKADRLPAEELARLRASLKEAGLVLRAGPEADEKLREVRRMYEPYVSSLADYLRVALPPWIRSQVRKDNWQTSAWEKSAKEVAAGRGVEEHF